MSRYESEGETVLQSERSVEPSSQGKKHLEIWLPAEVLDALDAEAEASGESRASLLVRLLSNRLGKETIQADVHTAAQIAKARRMRAEGKSMAEICDALYMAPDEAWSIADIRELFIYPAAPATLDQLAGPEPLSTERAGEDDAASTKQPLNVYASPQTLDRIDDLVAVLGVEPSGDMVIELAVYELWRQTVEGKQKAPATPEQEESAMLEQEELAAPEQKPEAVVHASPEQEKFATPEQKPEVAVYESPEGQDLKTLAGTPHYREALAEEARRLWQKGTPWIGIARQWNEQGIPTLTRRGQWYGASVSKLAMESLEQGTK